MPAVVGYLLRNETLVRTINFNQYDGILTIQEKDSIPFTKIPVENVTMAE